MCVCVGGGGGGGAGEIGGGANLADRVDSNIWNLSEKE